MSLPISKYEKIIRVIGLELERNWTACSRNKMLASLLVVMKLASYLLQGVEFDNDPAPNSASLALIHFINQYSQVGNGLVRIRDTSPCLYARVLLTQIPALVKDFWRSGEGSHRLCTNEWEKTIAQMLWRKDNEHKELRASML